MADQLQRLLRSGAVSDKAIRALGDLALHGLVASDGEATLVMPWDEPRDGDPEAVPAA
ncbi:MULTISPECIES: hypothetical protein [unclassified Kitasatospora]|uniref:hypothetical protein n=1 Tax=unclassified Kitasatospora TaxID=2633591 RepID=UPI003808803A